ncbi:MAG: amidohydrolase family protein [Proteobacteria bacterium]|nr:amidohydrolase family protein [Pseudomonadota bacterium]
MDKVTDVAILDGKIAAIEQNIDVKRSRRTINVAGLLVCPGLIDLHVHCNLYKNPESLDPTAAGVYTGVTRIVDPGDSGAYTFQSFRKAVIQNTPTRIHSWLNAAGLGGFMYGLYNTDVCLHPTMIDVDAAVEIARLFPEHIAGIKTYSAPEGWGSPDGTEVFDRAFAIADLARIPLYIHSGSPSPEGYQAYGGRPMLYGKEVTREQALNKMLDMLRPGDVVAHPFSTFAGTVWNSVENRVSHGVREAYARGVNFDSGRGAHYSYAIVRNLMNAGILPFTLSSDRHAEDSHDEFVRRASVGLCQHMSEFLAFGMSLSDVIMRATLNPAKVLRIQDRAGSIIIDKPAEISVLALREGDWTLKDAPFFGKEPGTLQAKQLLTPVMTVLDHRVYPVNPAFLPDLVELQVQEDVWSWMKERPPHHTAYAPMKEAVKELVK